MLAGLLTAWWEVSTRPSTATFKRAVSGEGHLRTLAGVLVAAALGVGASWATHWVIRGPREPFMGLASVWVKSGTPAPVTNWVVLVPLGVVYGFYSFEIVLFLFARLLGGKGSFGAQSYLQSLFYAPLAVVQQVVAVVPVAGLPLFFLLAACSLTPTTTSLKAAHRYSTVRAVLTWVLPILLNIVVVTAIVVLVSRSRR